jgi:hypothetical protein
VVFIVFNHLQTGRARRNRILRRIGIAHQGAA